MTVNVELLLAWLPRFYLGREKLVELCDCLSISTRRICIIGVVEPLSSVKRVFSEHLYKQRRRENIPLKADVVLFTALIAARNVVIGISKIYYGIISHFRNLFKGMLKQQLTAAPTLKLGVNTQRTHGNDRLLVAAFIYKHSFCIHDTADYPAIELKHISKLTDKCLVISHNVDKVMLVTARDT